MSGSEVVEVVATTKRAGHDVIEGQAQRVQVRRSRWDRVEAEPAPEAVGLNDEATQALDLAPAPGHRPLQASQSPRMYARLHIGQ